MRKYICDSINILSTYDNKEFRQYLTLYLKQIPDLRIKVSLKNLIEFLGFHCK